MREGRMTAIWQNLKIIKLILKNLNRGEFINIAEKINSIRDKLKDMQGQIRGNNISSTLFEEEKDHRSQLEKWDNIEENINKQKSRVHWLKLGDANNAYVFAKMKGRKVQNQIIKIAATTREVITNPKGIEVEVVGFYK